MKLTRELNLENVTALGTFLRRRPSRRRARVVQYCAGLVLFMVFVGSALSLLYVRSATLSPWWFAATPIVAALMWSPLWLVNEKQQFQALVRGNAAEFRQQEFWFDERGFGNSTPVGRTFHNWSAVLEVEDTPAFGFVSARGHIYCIRKTFADSDETSAFMKEVGARWRGAVERSDAPDGALS